MIERNNEEDNHKGTIFFAMGITALMVFALIWPQTIMATGLATFALCFGDGPAALIGTHAKNKINIRVVNVFSNFSIVYVLISIFLPNTVE